MRLSAIFQAGVDGPGQDLNILDSADQAGIFERIDLSDTGQTDLWQIQSWEKARRFSWSRTNWPLGDR